MENSWNISINSFGGFIPVWWTNTYPFYGNKNMASDMKNIDLIDPNVLTQGPAPVALTTGTEAAAVTTTVRSFMRMVTSDNVSFAIGGNKLYKISATAVSVASPFNVSGGGYVITHDGSEIGEDVVYYKSNLYYSYNQTGNIGCIGKYDMSTTFDDDWSQQVPTGKADLQGNVPHQMIIGGNDKIYFTNGIYVGSYNGTTFDPIALDFWTNSVCVSITWNENRIKVAVNRPNVVGANLNQSGVYTWNGVSSSWEGDPVEVNGKIGALYTKNGVTFVWWQDSGTLNEFNFGYINGTQLKPIKKCKGSLPLFYQVSEDRGFIVWISDGLVYYWGNADPDLPAIFFQRTSSTYTTTVGGIGIPFGTLLTSSHNATTGYNIAKASGYTVDSTYKTKAMDVSVPGYTSILDKIFIRTEQLDTGAMVDSTLTYNQGKETKDLEQIGVTEDNTTLFKILNKSANLEDFRLDLDFANGSTTNPVKVRSIFLQGHYTPIN